MAFYNEEIHAWSVLVFALTVLQFLIAFSDSCLACALTFLTVLAILCMGNRPLIAVLPEMPLVIHIHVCVHSVVQSPHWNEKVCTVDVLYCTCVIARLIIFMTTYMYMYIPWLYAV